MDGEFGSLYWDSGGDGEERDAILFSFGFAFAFRSSSRRESTYHKYHSRRMRLSRFKRDRKATLEVPVLSPSFSMRVSLASLSANAILSTARPERGINHGRHRAFASLLASIAGISRRATICQHQERELQLARADLIPHHSRLTQIAFAGIAFFATRKSRVLQKHEATTLQFISPTKASRDERSAQPRLINAGMRCSRCPSAETRLPVVWETLRLLLRLRYMYNCALPSCNLHLSHCECEAQLPRDVFCARRRKETRSVPPATAFPPVHRRTAMMLWRCSQIVFIIIGNYAQEESYHLTLKGQISDQMSAESLWRPDDAPKNTTLASAGPRVQKTVPLMEHGPLMKS